MAAWRDLAGEQPLTQYGDTRDEQPHRGRRCVTDVVDPCRPGEEGVDRDHTCLVRPPPTSGAMARPTRRRGGSGRTCSDQRSRPKSPALAGAVAKGSSATDTFILAGRPRIPGSASEG